MKPLKLLTFRFLVALCLVPAFSCAQNLTVKTGIYDFVENTASELYILAPLIMAERNVWKSSQMGMNLSCGFAFNRTKFNSHYHYLYMVPLLATVYYQLPNPGSTVWPGIGMGGSLLGKADHNRDFVKTHYSLAYGYHVSGRLNFLQKNGRVIGFEMTYNLLVPPVMEEVNLSGVILTVNLDFP